LKVVFVVVLRALIYVSGNFRLLKFIVKISFCSSKSVILFPFHACGPR